MESQINKQRRLFALDVMRGMTIVGMILFNMGSGHHYAPLHHAQWTGLTPADLAFPFFMFMMGITTYISLKKYNFAPSKKTFRKIVTRAIGICLVGYGLSWFRHFLFTFDDPDTSLSVGALLLEAVKLPEHLRWSGVLVRLGVCYGIAAIIAVSVKHKRIPYIIIGLLLLYTVILLCGNGFAYDESNILGIVDRAVLTRNHMYWDNGIDPEGILSTIPSVAHVLLGFWVGMKILGKTEGTERVTLRGKVLFLMLFGALMVYAAFLLQYGQPVSKKIWTPTFVMATCGGGALLLGLLLYFIDVKGHKGAWTKFFAVFGVNPLFLYVMHDVVFWLMTFFKPTIDGEKHTLWYLTYHKVFIPLFGEYGGDLANALLVVLLCWLIGFVLYKKKIYIKL